MPLKLFRLDEYDNLGKFTPDECRLFDFSRILAVIEPRAHEWSFLGRQNIFESMILKV